MKILIKIGKFLVNCTLSVLLIMLILSITLDKVITKDLLTNFLVEKISNETTEVIDKNFNNLDKQKINKINGDIKKNKAINNAIEKYARNTINIMASDRPYDINLLNEAKSIIKENKSILEEDYNIKITDKQIDEEMEKLDKEFKLNDYYNNLVKDTSKNISKEQKDALKLYKTITSTKFIIIDIILILILLIIIAIYNKSFYKWLKNLGVSGISASIINIVLFIIFTLVINSYSKDVNLKIINSITIPIIFLIYSILMYIVYYLINRKKQLNK